ncbi:MAG TPA: glycosyltransferase [Noviherbaspirillum sp.]|nr:glycosyltransferase [Noviherbaspirillum sp.]
MFRAPAPAAPQPAPGSGPKRILLLSVSAGAGHVRAAEAIRQAAESHQAAVEARHLDVMDYVPPVFRWLYTNLYISLVKRFPALWGQLYRISNEARPDGPLQRLRRCAERLNMLALRREIAAFAPDAIVCTHFLPAEMLAAMARKGRLACPVWVQVTDFDLHRIWVQPGVAGYFAANEEVAFRLRAHGVVPHAIRVTGIPIMPAFARAARTPCGVHEFGLDARRRIVLLMGGGAGLGSLEQVAAGLLTLDVDMQLIVLAGKNRSALAALQRLAARHPGRLLPLGFTDQVERLMACADLVITKPGGLTVAECLAMGLPAVLNAPIPGQEERNADFLLEQGVALKAGDGITLAYRVRHLLRDPARLAQMREKAAALGRPHAARHVLEAVLAGARADAE